MDASFDFGGGGGWGETGPGDFDSSHAGAPRVNLQDKISIPVTVADLCDGGIQEDKYHISGYAFSTVRRRF